MRDVTILVNDVPRRVEHGTTLAAALLSLGEDTFRRAGDGTGRGPVCGIGSCQECRLTVDDITGVRACLEPVRSGMRVETGK
jgi:hypothetical protein